MVMVEFRKKNRKNYTESDRENKSSRQTTLEEFVQITAPSGSGNKKSIMGELKIFSEVNGVYSKTIRMFEQNVQKLEKTSRNLEERIKKEYNKIN